ncbi:MAG: hypothetical protein ABI451_02935, partial [Dokdonella sp.]
MTQRTIRQYGRIARHFASNRLLEVLALQASPILGIVLGGYKIERHDFVAPGLLVLGSCALTAHI